MASFWNAKIYVTGLLCGVLLAAWLLVVHFLPHCWSWGLFYWPEVRKGNRIIANIETFRKDHGRLPDQGNVEEMLALGFELIIGYKPEYRVSADGYELLYYLGWEGEAIRYRSASRQWNCHIE